MAMYDDLEQQGRKASIGVFWFPKDDGDKAVDSDDFQNMQHDHFINHEQIEVEHPLGKHPPKPQQPQTDGQGTTRDDAATDGQHTDAYVPDSQ